MQREEALDMRVLLADAQAKVRSALRLLLEQEPDMEVAAEVSDGRALLAAAGANEGDIVLVDWFLPGVAPDWLVAELRSRWPHLYIIALSGRPEAAAAATWAGADAFVSKCDPPEALLDAVQQARSRGH
ncbi:MAG: response regulator transcription factor [Chloroflexi bacterium]|nr:response regulator transcription factor [Chloroflexota bacterium]